jgi:hypothetical protein
MVSRGPYNGANQDLWGSQQQQQQAMNQNGQAQFPPPQQDDDAQLDRRAAEAKKQAQASRKSIPPFVQKLSRFVVILLS